MNIGSWVRRCRSGSVHAGSCSGKWHLVESVVAEAAVTRCGRRMQPQQGSSRSGNELQVSDVMPLTRMIGQPQLCRGGCQREETLAVNEADNIAALMDVLEDDGSTHGEVEP